MICYLCDNENAMPLQRGSEAILHYIKCPNCGEYIISEQAITTHANKRDTRFIVAGEAFQLSYNRNEIKKIRISDFETSEDIPTIEKLYHLARYFYAETLKNGLCQKIKKLPRACCYAKNDSEYLQLWELLKSKNIIELFGNLKFTNNFRLKTQNA
ncbi:MAG: hypothetical protein LBC53_00430 [Spirochaetaceae bacterium]|jgi:transcriptional regulator with XRE-family HTH domain|nr:hypothetical protein [Spirochaetaceae bacterium]